MSSMAGARAAGTYARPQWSPGAVIGGVDTHKHLHVAAASDHLGAVLGTQWAAAGEYPVREVENAPFQQNLLEGEEVNVLSLPVPLWHEGDRGRFIGTGCFVMTRDPEDGTCNGGCYRMQVQDNGRAVTVTAQPGKHGAPHVDRWFEREGRAPVAVSFGHDPLLLVLGGSEIPFDIYELCYAGAVLGQRVPVVLGDITGLPIPAASEIVIEGWLTPDVVRKEGPFGEWTGYYASTARAIPSLQIDRLYYRDDPTQLDAPRSKPPHDYSYMRTVMKSAMIQDQLTGSGVPGIKVVWAPESGGGRLFVAVAIEQRYAGQARQVGFLAAQCPAAAYMNRYVVVVDDDIDVTSLDEIGWAISTRSDPAVDIDIMWRSFGSRLDPPVTEDAPPMNNRAVIDACIPYERRGTIPKVAQSSPELLRTTRERWGDVLAG